MVGANISLLLFISAINLDALLGEAILHGTPIQASSSFICPEPGQATRANSGAIRLPLPNESTQAIESIVATTQAIESAATTTQSSSTNSNNRTHISINDYTYWNSGKAISTFGFYNPKDVEQLTRPVEAIVMERMIKLRAGYKCFDGWRHNIEYHDKNNKCTHFDIFVIQLKCKYISIALSFALKLMHTEEYNWLKCCKMAIKKIDELEGHDDDTKLIERFNVYRHTNSLICARTIQRWHHEYRKNDECFLNITERKESVSRLPSIFDKNPDLHADMIRYCKNNIENLSVESVHSWFHEEGLPKLVKNWKKELENVGISSDSVDKNTILSEHNLTSLSMGTVLNWMTLFGFKYSPKQKTYYVDGHESKENVEHRKQYISQYLTDELRCFCWIQMTEAEAQQLVNENPGLSLDDGYKYNAEDNSQLTIYEFHVDCHNCLLPLVANAEFGGYLSVRKNKDDKPLIIFGQDECVFRQYCMNKKRWILPDGTAALLPKTDGQGIMFSSYTSRDFGHGFEMSDDDLIAVNKKREFEHYEDVESAKEVQHGSTKKPVLTSSPFICTFDYGKNREGYWTFSHLILQFEDIVDCLRVKFGDTYNFKFYFDNSSGHNKKRPNGLSSKSMNKYHGGIQTELLHDSEIKDESYLGEYDVEGKLKVGEIQTFQYKEGDIGPYYYSPEERIARKNDQIIPTKTVEHTYNTKELIQRINESTALNIQLKISYAKASEIAKKEGISLTYTKPKVIKGWLNKSKGMMQILYERGFINPNVSVKSYTEKGLKLPTGLYDDTLQYKTMVDNLPDFKGEQSRLEFFAEKLGVTVAYGPKYHPEIAGEGIEYCWALSKSDYRKQPLSEKKKKNQFESLVMKSMDTSTVLDIHQVRSCARSWILLFFVNKKIVLFLHPKL